ncbi:hypothetical protein [Pendulispora albinea]|uniref:Repeat protein (TIGR03806 family) n=1 Tax=Pendulispora albinea TaxID=2741071 RepID=A0ABZ2LQI0_9BACT
MSLPSPTILRTAAFPSLAILGPVLGALAFAGCKGDALRPIAPPGSATPVERLSQLGIFEGNPADQIPRPGFTAYDVNASLYADDLRKQRFVHVPKGARIRVSADPWDIPVGTYLVKTFYVPLDARDPARGKRLVETRFLVKTENGFTASTYVWNDLQTDAIVSRGDVDVPISWIDEKGARRNDRFHVPGTSECASCHEGRALAWRSRQLDRPGTYPDGTHDQVAHFLALGIIDRPLPEHALLSDPFGPASLDVRARSYLDANCGHCHGPGGTAENTGVFWDFESTDPRHRPACRSTAPVDGREHVLVPGHPEQSEFLARMLGSDSEVQMPRGPTRLPDRAGIALLSQWISAMPPLRCR